MNETATYNKPQNYQKLKKYILLRRQTIFFVLRKYLIVIMECSLKTGKSKIPRVKLKLQEAKITDFLKKNSNAFDNRQSIILVWVSQPNYRR